MQRTRSIMGMMITVDIVDSAVAEENFVKVFNYFKYIDEKFSTYKKDSEITQINNKSLKAGSYSTDMKTVLSLCEKTKQETNGYFDIEQDGKIDPSGLVKGWAIKNAAEILKNENFKNFYIDAGGDIQTFGKNSQGKDWTVGIRNPFNKQEIIKVLAVSGEGVATSGTYERGKHIYNPVSRKAADQIASVTVIGSGVYEADRFATAAFAMGTNGIAFIERQQGLEGYMIDKKGRATLTSGFENYTHKHETS